MAKLLNLNDETPTAEDEILADKLRALAFKIACDHPISAAHLTLAAAGIAPVTTFDLDVASYFFHELCDLSNEMVFHHRKALNEERPDGRYTMDEVKIRHLGPSLKAALSEEN